MRLEQPSGLMEEEAQSDWEVPESLYEVTRGTSLRVS